MTNYQISLDKKVYGLLKQGLDVSSLRSKVSANNIANINTKGYKRQFVTFEESLKDSQDKLELTDEKHMDMDGGTGNIQLKRDTTTSMNQDGNNVDIDNEMVNQAANNLMYNALVTQMNNRISITKYVINGK
ncbi:MAG: flagellar basal body rod protein FlgB [Solirubrobacterales bacterium]